MRRMIAITLAGLVLLTSAAAPASPRSFHSASGAASFHGPPSQSAHRPPVVPQMRKSCVRTRTRQIMQNLGHDWDLAVQEALLICG